MAANTSALKYLYPGWFAAVMGLAGLSLAWHRAAAVMGDGAKAAGAVLAVLATLVFAVLAVASLWRLRQHSEAWAEDLRHPVRHVFVAAMPVSVLLLATAGVAVGLRGPGVQMLWGLGAVAQLAVTVWVLSRWWQPAAAGGLSWAVVTPALIVPVVGNVLVPLAGVPLGHVAWSAAQFGVGLLFWPLVVALLVVRIAVQGLWPERLLPSGFILVAPPAVVGLSALQLGAALPWVWALWGMALICLLWVLPLLRRIGALPFGVVHWGMSFPMAAFTALSLALTPDGLWAPVAVSLLAATSLLVAALTLATVRGLRDGRLLAPETVPITTATAGH